MPSRMGNCFAAGFITVACAIALSGVAVAQLQTESATNNDDIGLTSHVELVEPLTLRARSMSSTQASDTRSPSTLEWISACLCIS